MAFAAIGSFATANQGSTAGASWTFATSATINVGDLAVLVIGIDNSVQTNRDDSAINSVTDAAGNSWKMAAEWQNVGTTVSHTGVSVWYSEITAQLTSGSNVVVTKTNSASSLAMACTGHRFSRNTAKFVVVEEVKHLEQSATDPGSLQLTSLENREHLFIRATAGETNISTYTATAAYTTFTHTSSNSTGGGAAANICARGEFKIETATSSTASDPTLAAVDCNSVLIGFAEIDVGVDAVTRARGNTVSSLTYSHTTSTASNRGLLVSSSIETTGTSVTGTTYNAVSMASEGSVNGGGVANVYLHSLIAPATGANNVVVTLTGSIGSMRSVATSLLGVNQSDFTGTFQSVSNAAAAAPTLTATISPNDLLWASMATFGSSTGSSGFANFGLLHRGSTNSTAFFAGGVMAGRTASISPAWAGTGTTNVMCAVPILVATASATVSPSPGAVTITGLAPAVVQNTIIAVGAGSIACAGQTPALVRGTPIAVPAGAITVAGIAPTALRGSVFEPASGAITITGPPPTLLFGFPVGAGAVSLTGHAPAVVLGTGSSDTAISPPAGSINLSGLAPTALRGSVLAPGAGAVAIAGLAPVGVVGSVAQPGAGQVSIAGQAPTVSTSSATDTTITPGAGSITVDGQAPKHDLGIVFSSERFDLFNRPDGALGSNWTTGTDGVAVPSVVSNTAQGTGGAFQFAYWNADSFTPDQEAEVAIGVATINKSLGPMVRASGSGTSLNGYVVYGDTVTPLTLVRITNSAISAVLGVWFPPSWTVGQTVKLTIVDDLLSVYHEGSLVGTATDSVYAGGQPGLFVTDGGQVDSWLARSIGAGITIKGRAPTVGVGTVAAPGAGTIAIAGQAPTLLRGSVFQPAAGSIAIDGQTPVAVVSVAGNTTVAPDAGQVSLTGYAPSLRLGVVVQPGAGAVALVGHAPTPVVGTIATPGAGSISIDGRGPTLVLGTVAAPGAGTVAITGHAPALLAATVVQPGAGSILVSGQTPSLARGAVLQPGAGAVVISGLAPAAIRGSISTPADGAIVIAGQAPTAIVSSASNTTVAPDAGLITIEGLAPSALLSAISTPPSGLVSISGLAPTLVLGTIAQPGAGAISLSGLAPALVIDTIVSPGAGSITISGQAPIALTSAAFAPGAGAILVSGLAPDLLIGSVVQPAAGLISLAGLAPSALVGSLAAPGAGSIAIEGHAPSLLVSITAQPGAGQITIEGQAPSSVRDAAIALPAGSITIDGHAPQAIQGANAQPDAGAVAISGHAPAALIGIVAQPGAGAIEISGAAPTTLLDSPTFVPDPARISIEGQAPTIVNTTPGADVIVGFPGGRRVRIPRPLLPGDRQLSDDEEILLLLAAVIPLL
jgi:hypothetical protein